MPNFPGAELSVCVLMKIMLVIFLLQIMKAREKYVKAWKRRKRIVSSLFPSLCTINFKATRHFCRATDTLYLGLRMSESLIQVETAAGVPSTRNGTPCPTLDGMGSSFVLEGWESSSVTWGASINHFLQLQ